MRNILFRGYKIFFIMVNPSLIFTISIVVVMAILFLIAAVTGILGQNIYVVFALLVLTVWGFALWLVIGYHPEWYPYRNNNPSYNRELFNFSLVVLVVSSLLFAVLLIFAIVHQININKKKTRRELSTTTSTESPVVISEATEGLPTTKELSTEGLVQAGKPSEKLSSSSELSEPRLDKELGTEWNASEILQAEKETKDIELVERIQLEQELEKTGTGIDKTKLKQDIQQKQQQLQVAEIAGEITPEEILTGTRIAQAKIKRAEAALETPSPSLTMFGEEGAALKMGTE